MHQITIEENFWQSNFGKAYTDRNEYAPDALDAFYQTTYGITRSSMNEDFLKNLDINSFLEVGCNIGNQLRLLQKQGFKNLNGTEIMDYAVSRAMELANGIDIVKGSALNLPFQDNRFDCVFTSGVLIHIHPRDIETALKEIARVSRRYIWGFEYFAEKREPIEYRGNADKLWKAPFASLYSEIFPNLKIIKREKYPYLTNTDNVDEMFLLEKA